MSRCPAQPAGFQSWSSTIVHVHVHGRTFLCQQTGHCATTANVLSSAQGLVGQTVGPCSTRVLDGLCSAIRDDSSDQLTS